MVVVVVVVLLLFYFFYNYRKHKNNQMQSSSSHHSIEIKSHFDMYGNLNDSNGIRFYFNGDFRYEQDRPPPTCLKFNQTIKRINQGDTFDDDPFNWELCSLNGHSDISIYNNY